MTEADRGGPASSARRGRRRATISHRPSGSGPASGGTLLEITDLRVGYRIGGRHVHWAVDGVSLVMARGEVLGLIGESGSGKSSLGRAIVGMSGLVSGQVVFNDESSETRVRSKNRPSDTVAMVFQDSSGSLDPRFPAWRSVTEPLKVRDRLRRSELRQRAEESLREVGLSADLAGRRPSQLSGGQRQRVNIARALVLSPDLVICDEPTSAVDVSAQAAILNLLKRLRERRGISYLFISHDLAVVQTVATRVAVMYLGKLVEVGSTEECIQAPAHPYTKALLDAVPDKGRNFLEGARANLRGEVADPRNVPSGCRFRTRCPYAQEICEAEVPVLREIDPGHVVACHFAEQLRLNEDDPPLPGAASNTITRQPDHDSPRLREDHHDLAHD
jgi:peptide/nickel transport system ATP-binding protein